ncbi:hypothetical protein ACFL1M_03025 [Patescibacteria group bacterium]
MSQEGRPGQEQDVAQQIQTTLEHLATEGLFAIWDQSHKVQHWLAEKFSKEPDLDPRSVSLNSIEAAQERHQYTTELYENTSKLKVRKKAERKRQMEKSMDRLTLELTYWEEKGMEAFRQQPGPFKAALESANTKLGNPAETEFVTKEEEMAIQNMPLTLLNNYENIKPEEYGRVVFEIEGENS